MLQTKAVVVFPLSYRKSNPNPNPNRKSVSCANCGNVSFLPSQKRQRVSELPSLVMWGEIRRIVLFHPCLRLCLALRFLPCPCPYPCPLLLLLLLPIQSFPSWREDEIKLHKAKRVVSESKPNLQPEMNPKRKETTIKTQKTPPNGKKSTCIPISSYLATLLFVACYVHM